MTNALDKTTLYRLSPLVKDNRRVPERYKVVLSKAFVMILLWSLGYWLCFGITYGYNAYFWDNSIAQNLILSVVSWWLFGLWVIGLMVLFSTVFNANTGVLLGTVGVVLASYLLGLLPRLKEYMPTLLTDGVSLIYGSAEAKTYSVPLVIATVMFVICFIVSIGAFNKKQL